MNRSSIRLLVAIAGAAAAVTLAGCGTGQLSQTADQAPAVDGTQATQGNIALRDIRIRAEQAKDYIQPGQKVELVFTATDQSPKAQDGDELVDITTDVGKVTLSGEKTLPAGGVLLVGTPAAELRQSRNDVSAATAAVALSEPITNGVNYKFTFTFAKAGSITVEVPISSEAEPTSAPSAHH